MTPEGKLTQLKRERDLLQQQANMLRAEMSEKKFQRPALEANIKSVQITLDVRSETGDAEGMKNARTQLEELKRTLLDVEESLQIMNSPYATGVKEV